MNRARCRQREGGTMNRWKLSTIVVAAVLFGFILAQLTGLGTVTVQSGAVAKVQLDTSNRQIGVHHEFAVPTGAIVVQAQVGTDGQNVYTYDICQ